MSTSTTTPDDSAMVGWISPDARRNTWDIIISCLSIFLVCSWKCVHLNPPTAEEARGEWHYMPEDSEANKGKWKIPIFPKAPLRRKWGRRLMWMVIISIAPELGVAVSVDQWIKARRTRKKMGDKFTLSHAFLFNMQGVLMREVVHRAVAKAEPTQPVPEGGGGDAEKEAAATVTPAGSSETDYVACPEDLELSGLTAIPTENDIADRSKSDIFTKVFALVQSGWLIMSSIARVYKGYAITELELATMAFIVCALAMYFFWWHKPFGIEQRWVMVRVVSPGQIFTRPDGPYPRIYHDQQRLSDLDTGGFIDLVLQNALEIADFEGFSEYKYYQTIALYLSGMAFSAVHVTAWNWEFPSRVIQILWRTSTVAAFAASFLPLTIILPEYLSNATHSRTLSRIFTYVTVGMGWGGLGVYVIARLIILFLTFCCFTAMPASVYEKVEWTGYIPHFS
ncbi:hypothetical protein QBC34DRAFT_418206 [Podospora aff. communis PSN243]|uniref:Uncharacterized protein n=1 Tax=Podospora aff. communis PSN243 TaxID=3040156 RepID=A0AAV9G4N3_9PEZI|nr:hypothetical protein QBC34DRAFT_418206 [Podospora aff. communis PSN243]